MRICVAPRGLLPAFRKGAVNRPAGSAVPGADTGVPGATAPGKTNLKPPLPRRGRGAGGWGQKVHTRSGQTGDGRAQASLPVPHTARHAVTLPVQTRGCKGRSPLQKITWNLPPSPEGKGGGWGKIVARKAGSSRRCREQAPPGAANCPVRSAAPGAVAGMQGAKPLAKDNLESPPSPEGKGVGGMGARTVIQEPGKPPGTKTANTQKATPSTQKISKPLDKQGKVWYTTPAMKRSCLASTAPPQSASGQYPIPATRISEMESVFPHPGELPRRAVCFGAVYFFGIAGDALPDKSAIPRNSVPKIRQARGGAYP